MKTFLSVFCLAGVLLLASFEPPVKKRRITAPLENHVGHIQWVQMTPYEVTKDSSGSIVKGALMKAGIKSWTYDEYGDELENDEYDASGKPKIMASYQYYPNGDVKERTKDTTIVVRTGRIIEHYNGYRGRDRGVSYKGVEEHLDYKYDNRYDAWGNLLYTSGDLRLNYGATSCKFFYDSYGKMLEKDLYESDTIHPIAETLFRYNRRGQLTEQDESRLSNYLGYYNYLKPDTKTLIDYDTKGRVAHKAHYTFQVGLTESEETTYDDAGDTSKIEETDYGKRTNEIFVSGTQTTQFLKKGQTVQKDVYDNKGNLRIFDFDLGWHLLDMEEFQIKPAGAGTTDTVMVHHLINDKHFNGIEDAWYDNTGKLAFKNTWQYKYDNIGNWVEKIQISNGQPAIMYEREIHYFNP